jgi:hypothetical protein
MELMPALRLIWRRRLALVAAAICAVAILVALGGTKPITTRSAVAWTSVALDTPKSQLVEVAPTGAGTLSWRASLLAHLLATQTTTQELAQRLGVDADQVMVVDPALAQPLVPTAMAQAAATAASDNVAPYVLTAFVENSSLPIISLEAAAPSLVAAQRLADAGAAVFEAQASPGGRFVSPIATNAYNFSLQPFVVRQVAPVRVEVVNSTALPMKAIGASLFVFLTFCAVALLLPATIRRVRAAARPLPA